MGEKVHGHEVMRMMIASNETYTRQSLRQAIHDRFGTETRFHTCSADGMTAEELIDFLESKGKFLFQGSEFTTHADRMCDHE